MPEREEDAIVTYPVRDLLSKIDSNQTAGFARIETALSQKADRADVARVEAKLENKAERSDLHRAEARLEHVETRVGSLERGAAANEASDLIEVEARDHLLSRKDKAIGAVISVAMVLATLIGPHIHVKL